MKYSILWIALIIIGCTSPSTKTNVINTYFNITSFTQQLIMQQSKSGAIVLKKTIVNGDTEEKIVANADSLFWATELTPLINSDINKPALLDAFRVEEGVKEVSSNLLKTTYSALPQARSNVKLIEIKYLDQPTEVRQIYAVIKTDNPVYSTHQSIHIWLNSQAGQLIIDSLYTQGFNKTILLDSLIYSSVIRIQ